MKLVAHLEHTNKTVLLQVFATGKVDFFAPVNDFSEAKSVEVVFDSWSVMCKRLWVDVKDLRDDNGELLPSDFWQKTELLDINRAQG